METDQIQVTTGDISDSPVVVEGKKFGIRAGSWIIDLILLQIINYAVSFMVGLFIGMVFIVIGRDMIFDDSLSTCIDLIAGVILMVVYTTLFEGLYGATIGKLILGMRVVSEDGSPCDLSAGIVRGVLRLLDGLFLGIPAYITMKPPLYQRIGDQSAKTIVVSSKDPFIKEDREWQWLLISGGLYILVACFVALFSLLLLF